MQAVVIWWSSCVQVFAVDRRMPSQQVDDLLAEICDEVEIDSRHDPAKDVQERLDHLKGGKREKYPIERSGSGSDALREAM